MSTDDCSQGSPLLIGLGVVVIIGAAALLLWLNVLGDEPDPGRGDALVPGLLGGVGAFLIYRGKGSSRR